MNRSPIQPNVAGNFFRYGPAFTLVELLVVIALTGILAGLLLPSLKKASALAQAAQCLGNTRQIALGWLLYTDDYNGNLAPNLTNSANSWIGGVLDFSDLNSDNTNAQLLVNPQYAKLGPYIKTAGSYKCPADKSFVGAQGSGWDRVRSYAMNFAVGKDVPSGTLPFGFGWMVYTKTADLMSPGPANLWLLVDEHPDSIDDGGFMVDLQTSAGRFISVPAHYHQGASSFAYADGHAAAHRWLDARTLLPNRYCGCLAHYAEQGFYTETPDSPDVAWLQERTSHKLN